jgi:uncharacterized repeat protein (TIGR01451 family)
MPSRRRVTSCAIAQVALLAILASTAFADAVQIQVLTAIDYPGAGSSTTAFGINAAGDVAGDYVDTGGVRRGFVRYADGTFSDPIIHPLDTGNTTRARGINRQRTVVGDYLGTTNAVTFQRDFVLHGGNFHTVGAPGADFSTAIFGINDASDVTGAFGFGETTQATQAFAISRGTFRAIPIANVTAAFGVGINNLGDVVGFSTDANGANHGFLANTTFVLPVNYPGSTATALRGINDIGWMVGSYRDGTNKEHGLLRTGQTGAFVTFDYPGATATSLNGINNAGLIAGRWTDGSNVGHGFLARAVAVTSVSPDSGGDTGTTTVTVRGIGFVAGAAVALAKTGESPIPAAIVNVLDGRTITATFDLRAATQGAYDVVVTNADASSATLPNGFAVLPATEPKLNVYIPARPEIGIGRPMTYRVVVNNTGNTDAFAVPVNLFFPNYLAFQLKTALVEPSQLPGAATTIDYSQVPIAVPVGDETLVPLIVPFVPAGGEQTIVFTLQTPIDESFVQAYLDSIFSVRVTVAHPMLAFGDSTFTAAARGSRRPRAATIQQLIQDLFMTPDGRNCLSSLLQVGFNALGVVPFEECAKDIAADIGFALAGGLGNATSSASAGNIVMSAVQADTGVLQLVLDCSGVDVALVQVIAAINTGISIAIAADNCNVFLESEANTKIVAAIDPNAKTGPEGAGTAHAVRPGAALTYVVDFENLSTASAPAQEVVVTDQLDPSVVDVGTLSLGAVQFGDHSVPVPPGTQFNVQVDLRPETPLLVNVTGSLDAETGLLTWRFQSIDPETGLRPEAPSLGFLPPNVVPPEGQGSVSFTVNAKADLATGTAIANAARIVFDLNAPIDTPAWSNAIDATPPVSRVDGVRDPSCSSNLAVSWSGTDADAGVADFSIFVSENGGAFTPWLTDTAEVASTFPGEAGKTYGFYSVARDGAGNVENAPATPDVLFTADCDSNDLAVTKVVAPKVVTLSAKTPHVTKPLTVHVQNRSPHPIVIPDPATLAKLVTVDVQSSGACAAPVVQFDPGKPKKSPAVTVKSKKSLKLRFAATYVCANDPLKTSAKNPGHGDFTVSAAVHHDVLGSGDAHPADDACPRSVPPSGSADPFPDGKLVDKGCGAKKADKRLGDPIVVDVVVK